MSSGLRVQYGLRCALPASLETAIKTFDDALYRALQLIVVAGRPGFGAAQWELATLPLKRGGLGVLKASLLSKFSYVNSYEATRNLQGLLINGTPDNPGPAAPSAQSAITDLATLLPETDPSNFAKKNPLSTWAKPLVDEQASKAQEGNPRISKLLEVTANSAASSWLLLPPDSSTLSPEEHRCLLKYRLGIPITYEHRCSRCLTVQDHWGDHAVNCARTPGVKQRHERLVHALGHLLSLANIRHSINDSNVEFLGQDSQGNLRPADILIPNWNGERSLCIDVTIVSPFRRGSNLSSSELVAAAAARKRGKHEAACQQNGFDFLPFATSTFGDMDQDATTFLKRVQRALNEAQYLNMSPTLYADRLDRLVFAIQKGVARQLTARMS